MIRKTSENWQGEVDSSNDFEAFENDLYGVRAGMVKLHTFWKKGFHTVRMICKYWDSSMSDDDVLKFTSYVERRSQKFADAELNGKNSDMSVVASAMSAYFLGDNFSITPDEFASTSRRFSVFGD